MTAPIVFRKIVSRTGKTTAADFLTEATGFSKTKIKRAMDCGAVWISRPGASRRRLRRATFSLKQGDWIELFHDESILALTPPQGRCIEDFLRYSVWYKPAGLLAQGTDYGDHCCILRQAERFFKPPRLVFPVHRLDREAAGLMLIAHDRRAAGALSGLFARCRVTKEYRLEVVGDLSGSGAAGRIDFPLDGKPARTAYTVVGYDSDRNITWVRARIETGRKHQIRRHFDAIGFPVFGDPRYGRGNKNRDGLRLTAQMISFQCPLSGQPRRIELPADFPPDS